MTVITQSSSDFPSQNDNYQRLWVPHRMVYLKSDDNRGKTDDTCPFCSIEQKTDDDALIVFRGKTVFANLNLYPYNSGHLMVLPYRHVSYYEELSSEERDELSKTTADALKVLRSVLNPDGFNLGINQGEVAGAGIASHLHQHIVPRWKGDANFFPIVAQTKTMPSLLGEMRAKIFDVWQNERIQ